MIDNIVIGKSLRVNGAKPLDYLYGPYRSVEDMKKNIPQVLRYKGLTGAVIDELRGAIEFWFKAGITDGDLVEKLTGADSTPYNLEENVFNALAVVYPKVVNLTSQLVYIDVATTLNANHIRIKRNNVLISESSVNTNYLDYVDTVPENLLSMVGTPITYVIEATLDGISKTIIKSVNVGTSETVSPDLIPVNLLWSVGRYTTYTGSGFTPSFPTLSGGSGLNITYTSSNTNVATVNSAGNLTIILPGATTISAYFIGDSTHSASNVATYVLTVEPDTITSISVNGSVSPSRITTEQTATVTINGATTHYKSGYTSYVSRANLTVTVYGGTLVGTTFTPSGAGEATILVSYEGKTVSMKITVTEPEVQKKNVEFGVGTSYENATWTVIGPLTNNLEINGVTNNSGDYFFIKYDKNDIVNSLWINASISTQIPLDSSVIDGEYRYRKTSTSLAASRSPENYIINKIN